MNWGGDAWEESVVREIRFFLLFSFFLFSSFFAFFFFFKYEEPWGGTEKGRRR